MVIGRPTPGARVLSKKTVSPMAIAVTIETARSIHAPAEIVVNAAVPAVASTQKTRIAPPIVERTALTATEPRSGKSVRAIRLVTAHISAAPSEARAPSVVSAITGREAGPRPGGRGSPPDNPAHGRPRS